MVDYIEVGIKAVTAALALAREVLNLSGAPQINKRTIQEKLDEMMVPVKDAQMALEKADVEITSLRASLHQIQRVQGFGDDFILAERLYWYKGFPYCPQCWDHDRKLTPMNGPWREGGTFSGWSIGDVAFISRILRLGVVIVEIALRDRQTTWTYCRQIVLLSHGAHRRRPDRNAR